MHGKGILTILYDQHQQLRAAGVYSLRALGRNKRARSPHFLPGGPKKKEGRMSSTFVI